MSHGGLRLFLGPDRPRKLQRIQDLERTLAIQPLDRHQLDAAALTATQLLAVCRQQPALSRLRLVVVDQAHRLDCSSVDALLEHAELIGRNACVILLVEMELGVRHALSKATSHMATERFSGRDTAAVKPFALTDALGTANAAGALTAVRDQLLGGKEPLEVLGLIGWQLNRWVMVKRLLDERVSAERIGAVMGLRPWQVQRLSSEVVHRPLRMLQDLLARCWQLDVEAKRGRALPQLALEQLIIEICSDNQEAASVV